MVLGLSGALGARVRCHVIPEHVIAREYVPSLSMVVTRVQGCQKWWKHVV